MAGNYFLDEATGKLIPEEDVSPDTGVYLYDEPQDVPEEPGLGETVLRTGDAAILGVGKALSGAARAGADVAKYLGADSLGDWLQEKADNGAINTAQEEERLAEGYLPDSWKKTAVNFGQNIVPLGAALATGALPGAAIFGADTALEEYGANRAQGQDPYEAAKSALPDTAISTAMGVVPGLAAGRGGLKGVLAATTVGTGLGYGAHKFNQYRQEQITGPTPDYIKAGEDRENWRQILLNLAAPMAVGAGRAMGKKAFPKTYDALTRNRGKTASPVDSMTPEELAKQFETKNPFEVIEENPPLVTAEGELPGQAYVPRTKPLPEQRPVNSVETAEGSFFPEDASIKYEIPAPENIYGEDFVASKPYEGAKAPEYSPETGIEANSQFETAEGSFPEQRYAPATKPLPPQRPINATETAEGSLVTIKRTKAATVEDSAKAFPKPLEQSEPKATPKATENVENQKPQEAESTDNGAALDNIRTNVLADRPIVDVRVKDTVLSKDVPNWKRGANAKTGEVPGHELKGKYQKFPKKPIVLWERLNGILEVITGRHRRALALRNGDETIPAQIVREADGFTKEMAALLDAEENIQDGKGTTRDQALYFRERSYGEGEATERGLLSTDKSRKAFSIATRGSEEVYQLYQNERLTDAQAATIAEAAPNNPTSQLQGVRAVEEGANLLEIGQRVRAAALIQSGDLRIVSSKGQGDLFGTSDTVAQSQEFQDRMGKFAAKHIYDLQEDIRALASQKRPDRAAKGGIQVDIKAATEKRALLERELDDWSHWNTNKNLTEQLRQEVLATGDQQRLKFKANSETGAIGDMAGERPIESLAQDIQQVRKRFEDTVDLIRGAITGKYKDVGQLKPEQAHLEGRDGVFQALGVPQLKALYRKIFEQPRTFAARFPEKAKAVQQAMTDFVGDKNQLAQEATNYLHRYFKAPSASQERIGKVLTARRIAVDQAIAEGRGVQPLNERQLLRLGLTPDEASVAMDVRKYFAGPALRNLKEKLTLDGDGTPEYSALVDNFISELSRREYVPFFREAGRFDLQAIPPKGSDLEYYRNFFDSYGELKKAQRELISKGYNPKRIAMVQRPEYEASPYAALTNTLLKLKTEGGVPPGGFLAHLLRANLVEGYNKNLTAGLSQYASSQAEWLAKSRFDRVFNGVVKTLDIEPKQGVIGSGSDNALANQMLKWRKDLFTPSKKTGLALIDSFNLMYLAGVPISGIVNATQVINTMAEAVRYVRNPLKAAGLLASGAKAAAPYLAQIGKAELSGKPVKFNTNNAMRDNMLQLAYDRGRLAAQPMGELYALRSLKGLKGKAGATYNKVNKVLMSTFSVPEVALRVHAALIGDKIAQARGFTGDARYKFIENFIIETQHDQTEANRPALANWAPGGLPVGRLATLYKLFAGNQLRYVRNRLNKQDWPAAATVLGAGVALAGLTGGLPFAKDFLQLAEGAGFDIKRSMKETFGDYSDLVQYGVPAQLGYNISGNVGAGQYVPDLEKDSLQGVLKSVFGAAGDLPYKEAKAYELAKKYRSPWYAAKQGLPRFFRGPMNAYEALTKGQISDYQHRPILTDPTIGETLFMAIGGQPSRIVTHWDEINSQNIAKKNVPSSEVYNTLIANAYIEGDDTRANDLVAEAQANGIKPNSASIRKNILEAQAPQIAAIKKAPRALKEEYSKIAKTWGQKDF